MKYLVVLILASTVYGNLSFAASKCAEQFSQKMVLKFKDAQQVDMNLLVGNNVVIKAKPSDARLKVMKGFVTDAYRLSDGSIFITYVDSTGQRYMYEHYPFMQNETENLVSISFENNFRMDLKKAALLENGYKPTDKQAYLMLPERYPGTQLALFVQKKGVAELKEIQGELVARPTALDYLMDTTGQKPMVLKIKLADGSVVDVVYSDFQRMFVK